MERTTKDEMPETLTNPFQEKSGANFVTEAKTWVEEKEMPTFPSRLFSVFWEASPSLQWDNEESNSQRAMRLNESLLRETKNSYLIFQFPPVSSIPLFVRSYDVTYIF